MATSVNTIKKMRDDGTLKYEFSVLGVPETQEEVEGWIKKFLDLRTYLDKNYDVTFESAAFCEKLSADLKRGV